MESFTLKNQSLCTKTIFGLLLAAVTLTLSSCSQYVIYKVPEYNFAGRPIPPSQLLQRVLVGVTVNGTTGNLTILDGLRDIRNNVQNTVTGYHISGYSSAQPSMIINYPDELEGFVYSQSDGSVAIVSYSKEATNGSAGTAVPSLTQGIAIPSTDAAFYAAEEQAGILAVSDASTGRGYALNLPNVFNVVINQSNTIVLAMVRNSNTLYRVVKLNPNQATPPGATDCQPYNLPVYCVVPVVGTYDRPYSAYFSLDGTAVYVLDCGPECGGTTAGITVLTLAPLNINQIPTTAPDTNAVTNYVAVPGGVTDLLSDGTTLYAAGQQLLSNGLFAGNLSTIALSNYTVTGTYSISDGTHTKMLFADNNTLWIGSQYCASGERQLLFSQGNTTQAANYNCLTRVVLPSSGTPLTPYIVPAVNQAATGVTATQVPYPNENLNPYYYGNLTGLCWVQNLGKVYTAYGGQVHAFLTADGSEINNQFITVQGTALDVAYMDALNDTAD